MTNKLMSGHSKWHNIQARKGKQDAARSSQFSKLSKLITVAARSGGDLSANFSLRLAVEKAKDVGMPKDNIDRAIKKGTGELEGAQIEEAMYECYGPGGVAVLVKCLTDNKNRTVSDLKRIFADNGGGMAGAGSVMWMFYQAGLVTVPNFQLAALRAGKAISNFQTRDEFDLALIEAGAEDIIDEDGDLIIKTKVENFQKVLNEVKTLGLEPAESGLQWVAKDKAPVSDEVAGKLRKLFEELDSNDDVEDYFTNAE